MPYKKQISPITTNHEKQQTYKEQIKKIQQSHSRGLLL